MMDSHSEESAFFNIRLLAGAVEKPFHPQAQISRWPANAWYLYLLFLIYEALAKLTVEAVYDRLSWGSRGIREE